MGMCLFLTIGGSAQNRNQVDQLAKLAKVWGFLKYYHSAASGSPDWDKALLELIPEAINRPSHFETHLFRWYQGLPVETYSPIPTQSRGDSVYHIFTVKNIRTFGLKSEFTRQLTRLFTHHLPAPSVYVTDTYKGYSLDFLLNMEEGFEESYPSTELRLLALFRFWNIINYQYPHKNQLPLDWDRVLKKYIPYFIFMRLNRRKFIVWPFNTYWRKWRITIRFIKRLISC